MDREESASGAARSDRVDLLGELVRRLEGRATVAAAERRRADRAVIDLAARAAAALVRPPRTEPATPPRRVATAMALAVLSAPHLGATLPDPVREGAPVSEPPHRRPEAAMTVSDEGMGRALGLPAWELEELREEVDRRAGRALKGLRTLSWLWSRFPDAHRPGPGEALVRFLAPGLDAGSTAVVRRGAQLYLLTDLPPSDPPASLFLPWLASDPSTGPASFRSRSVEASLRHRIALGVGADDQEVSEILEGMVAFVPRERTEAWLHADQWRTHGFAALTDLGAAYSLGDWLVRPLPADGADWRAWIRHGPDGLRLKGAPEKLFDALALPRVAAMSRLLYAATLASLDRDAEEPADLFRVEDTDLLDVPLHLRAVLAPLLAWPGRSSTHRHLASELKVDPGAVRELLLPLQMAWRAHASAAWWGAPGLRSPSIQTLLLEHVLVLQGSLRHLIRRAPDPRRPHADALLLFTAHYLREARLERLWLRSLSDVAEGEEGRLPPPDDVPGVWFWRAWTRLLAEADAEAEAAAG